MFFRDSIVSLIVFFSLVSCGDNRRPEQTAPGADTARRRVAIKDTYPEEKSDPVADSLKVDSLLTAVLKFANQNKDKPAFQGQMDSTEHDDRLYVSYLFGNIFAGDQKHLLIKRHLRTYIESALYSDIYILKNNTFKKVIADTTDQAYTGDELQDVNSDGYIDYIVSSYSGVGCCPRDDKVGYLYNKRDGGFVVANFFNPEFNDAEKIVYNTNYGYPGQIAIDKSRWDAFEMVLVESIYPTRAPYKLDSFVKPYTFTRITYPDKREQVIKDVPEEYKKLKIYEYFISYQE